MDGPSSETAARIARDTALSEQQARVVVLRREDYSWGEIADVLDIQKGTAREYHERAESKYRQAKATVEELEQIGFGSSRRVR